LTLGRSMWWASRKARNAISSSVLVRVRPRSLRFRIVLSAAVPSALWVACEQGVDGERACEAAVLGLVDRPLESLGRQLLGQIHEGAGGGRDRDAVVDRDLVFGQRDAVRGDAGQPAATGDSDLRAGARGVADAPQGRRGAVAQHRAGPGGEHRRQPLPPRPQDRVADRVHAAMHGVKQPAHDAVIDSALPEPEREQLRPRHDAVLTRRERRDLTRGTLTPYSMPNVPRDRHSPMVATRGSRITTQTHQLSAGTPSTQAPSPFDALTAHPGTRWRRARATACAGLRRYAAARGASAGRAPAEHTTARPATNRKT
jgi:hypothetical protein